MTEAKELNRKLAEWAGFKFDKGGSSMSGIYIRPRWYCSKPYYKDLDLPDFTESLAACFKWLMPKAIKEFGGEQVYQTVKIPLIGFIFAGNAIAPALCLAIEELIDKEVR